MQELFPYAQLTTRSSIRPDVDWCVVDLETTGLEPASSRVIEVAAVRLAADGTIVDEFATLINPGVSTAGKTQIHKIELRDLTDAPPPDVVWPAVASRVAGAVLVAHNLEFEERFLLHELQLAGVDPSAFQLGLDTLTTSRMHLRGFPYKLGSVHQMLTGQPTVGDHAALADARATARVLQTFLGSGRLGWSGLPVTPVPYTPLRIPVKARSPHVTYALPALGDLPAGLPNDHTDPPVDPAGQRQYRMLLTAALAEPKLSRETYDALARQATTAGFTQRTLMAEHADVLADLRSTLPPGPLDRAEQKQLWTAATALNRADDVIDLVPVPPTSSTLNGERVIIVSNPDAAAALVDFVTAHGGRTGVRITATATLVVADTPNEDLLSRAADLNIPVMSLPAARAHMAALVDSRLAATAAALATATNNAHGSPTPPWREQEFPGELVVGWFGYEDAHADLDDLIADRTQSGSRSDVATFTGINPAVPPWQATGTPAGASPSRPASTPTSTKRIPGALTDADWAAARSTQRLSAFALVLSLLGLFIVPGIVAVWLAVKAIRSATRARRPAPGMAIIALAITAAWLTFFIVQSLVAAGRT